MRLRVVLLLLIHLSIVHIAFGQTHLDSVGHRSDKADGNRKMIELLAEVNRNSYKYQNPFATTPRIEFFRELTRTSPDNRLMMCQEFINGGLQDEAIDTLLAFKARGNSNQKVMVVFDRVLALAYMRQGEQDNCVSNHTSQSCLFPLGPGGYHANKRGSRAAIEVLRSILDRDSNDLQSRWLLNIAYQTLEEYPDSVPQRWLLPPSLFQSDYPLPRFTNIAPQLGIDEEGLAGGCCTEDFDGDGDLDIVTSSYGMKSPMRYYRNNGDGTFTEATKGSGLEGLVGGLNMIHGDYNNDGYPDILVLRGAWMQEFGRYPNSLLRNNGDGTFTDVTAEAGLLSFHPTQAAVFADFNNDGWLDIFIGNESGVQRHPCEFFMNNRDGTFTECSHSAGLDLVSFVKGVACGDFNNDGLPDLYLSCHGSQNHLLRNNGVRNGKLTFTDVSVQAGVTAPISSFPTFFFDYDNDGWEDIFVCSYGVQNYMGQQSTAVGLMVRDYLHIPNAGEVPRLYHNNHDGTFTDVTHEANLDHVMFGMGANFGDIDNDGYLDIYVGTGLPDFNALMPNRMFRNNGGRGFQDVTTAGGFGHLQKGHAIAFADFDNDGDQDVYAVMGGAFEGDLAHRTLFENPGNGNHWVALALQGVRSNRSAIGARIKVSVATPTGGRDIYKTVNTGGSFGSSMLQQEIGLGDAVSISSITITWPASRTKQVFRNVTMDRFYAVREDAKVPTRIDRPVIHFNTNAPAATGMDHQHMMHDGQMDHMDGMDTRPAEDEHGDHHHHR
ncbi:MAG: CRTAC1 family protein [Bacteroidetes bacterium]|nr:CRTAC1 family protein [Bacteroidota bacterium]